MTWVSLRSLFHRGDRRSETARLRLTRAYQNVFRGNGTTEEAEIVLADLANATGFYRVNGIGFSDSDRAFSDGQRAAFARIFKFLRMSAEEVHMLEEAARAEALASSEEHGEF